jgi:hypothetical protein
MAGLLLGITLTLWGLSLLSVVVVSSTVLGLFALVTGIVWILVSVGVALPAVPTVTRRHPEA